MTKIIVAKERINCEHLLGQFVDDTSYDILVEEDTDCYMEPQCGAFKKVNCNGDCEGCTEANTKDEKRIAFKFRKNFFSKKEQEQAYQGLREAAVSSQNRGLAAGPKGEKCGDRDWVTNFQIETLEYLRELDAGTLYQINVKSDVENLRKIHKDTASTRGMVWLSNEISKDKFTFEEWLKKIYKISDKTEIRKQAESVLNKYISDTTYANPVFSGIAGWFDRYPRIPYGRSTSYTQHNYDKFKMGFPFLQTLNDGFKDLLPWRWGNQKAAADKIDQKFLVPGTVFTTITVNKTFRTACHRDAGDFSDGLSNLLVLSNNGNYSGGYLVFPEYRVAVNVRPGDLLLVNNHEIIHGNTPIVMHDDVAERISLVCYLRENMLQLGEYDYENLRYQFVESRRLNKEHPGHKYPDGSTRHLWNGVSEGMWESDEWFDFLEANNGTNLRKGIKDKSRSEAPSSLESLFG
jgi:hypothetical protein